jgi:hypothetical protein
VVRLLSRARSAHRWRERDGSLPAANDAAVLASTVGARTDPHPLANKDGRTRVVTP